MTTNVITEAAQLAAAREYGELVKVEYVPLMVVEGRRTAGVLVTITTQALTVEATIIASDNLGTAWAASVVETWPPSRKGAPPKLQRRTVTSEARDAAAETSLVELLGALAIYYSGLSAE